MRGDSDQCGQVVARVVARILIGTTLASGFGPTNDAVRRARLPTVTVGAFGGGTGSNAASSLPSAARSGSRRGHEEKGHPRWCAGLP